MTELGTCPKCNGSTRRPCPPEYLGFNMAGLDRTDNTLPCDNCGGQTMSLRATGKVPLRPDGSPCMHEYKYRSLGNCLHGYTCIRCGHRYEIDSSD